MQMHALKYALSFVALFTTISFWAQIKNGGFEQCTAYPSQLGQVDLAAGWSNAGSASASPDLFHYAGNMAGDIPVTPVAEVDAHSGNAVAGFAATGVHQANYREYLCNHLTDALQAGETYRLSFMISNGYWTDGSLAGLKTSDLGVYLTVNAPVQTDNHPLEVSPQAKLDTVLYSREWVEITFDFQADAAYEYLTLGVFGLDGGIDIEVEEGVSPQVAYYFVDDVSLISLSSPEQNLSDSGNQRVEDLDPDPSDLGEDEESFFIPNAFTPNHDGDNDLFVPVLPNEVRDYHMQIYARWGEVVFESTDPSYGWNGRSVKDEDAQPGMYIWQIDYLEFNGEDWIPAERQGTVYLLR